MTNNHTPKTELPAGWVEVQLGALLEFEYGKGLTKKQRNEHGEFPVYGSNGIVGYHDEFLIEGPVLIVGRKGAAGEVALSQADCWPIDTTYFVRVPGDLSLEFCYHLLKSLRLDQFDRSTAIPGLNRNDAYRVRVNLPPLPEQHRIVAKIEELFSDLDHSVAALETARQQLDIYRQAVLKHAFEGKLTEQWRKDHPDLPGFQNLEGLIRAERDARYRQELAAWQAEVEAWEAQGKPGRKPRKTRKPKELPPLTEEELAELPSLPEGWGWVQAEALSEFITKGTTPKKQDLYSNNGEIPFIKVYNLTHTGKLDFGLNPTFTNSATHNGFLARSIVFPGDVLMNIVGPPLGKVSLVPDTYPEWNINQAIVRYRPYDTILSRKYLKHFLLSETTIRGMMRKSKATAGQFNLTLEICRDLLIPLCSLPEQRAIVEEIEARLSVVDKLAETIDAALQQAEALRQSILKQAFAGKLVPQNPNDEPAERLLERIKNNKS